MNQVEWKMNHMLYYSRVMSKLGFVTPSKDNKYLEMTDMREKEKKLLLLSKKSPLEKVNYVLLDNKILIVDLLVLKDFINNCRFIFEIDDYSVSIYRVSMDFEISEESFYNDLTNFENYIIINNIDIDVFKKMKQDEFLMFLSSLNGGTGTIEPEGNIRKVY